MEEGATAMDRIFGDEDQADEQASPAADDAA